MANTKITSHVIESGAVESTHIASGAITASHVTGITTANITENTNLYYTDTRARASISVTGGNLAYDSATGVLQLTDAEIRDALSATSSGDGSLTYTAGTGVIAYTGPSASEVQAHLSAGTGVTYSGGQFSIGQSVGTSDTVSFGNITTAGYLRGPANFTIDPAAYGDDTGTLIIAGNLQVDGTTTTINSTTLTVDDLNLTLASGAANAAAANGAGITVDGASATLLYQASGDKFVFNKGLDVTGNIGVTGTVDGVDIAARDAVLTSTTTTAGAALPKAGGTMTGDLLIQKAEPIINLRRSDNDLLPGLLWQGSAGAQAASIRMDGDSGTTNSLVMSTFNGSSVVERLRILTDAGDGIQVTGNVGINTADPGEALDVAGTALVENTKLKAIAASNTDTAVDVFVYDTRKDSDGGAWRKRTQNTSWYKETLNTATRGSRKEFPAVAVIVYEEDQATIYDGDDPDLPMWMVFNAGTPGASNLMGNTGRTSSALYALNAEFLFCSTNSQDQTYVNFIKDYGFHKYTSATVDMYKGNIAQRNDGLHYFGANDPRISGALINRNVNDVAMTVLPNAPINADTGLPVPTIAVATDGGISLINDNGVIVNYTNTQDSSTFNFCDNVFFRGDGAMVWQADSTGNSAAERFTRVVHVPRKSGTFVETSVAGSSALDEFYAPNQYAGDLRYIQTPTGVLASSPHGKAGLAAGQAQGLNIISPNRDTPTEGLINYITSDYNTGWMHGDIKLATLSDTDTTNAGAEIVTNGDFATNSDWTLDAGWSIAGGKATHDSTTGNRYLTQGGILEEGKQYVLIFTISDYTSGTLRIYGGTAQPVDITEGVGTYTIPFIAASGGDVNFQSSVSAAFVGSISNVSCKLAEQDRSYNKNGLQVFGTVTKTAVATGAELVGYSGFSSSNYLLQPYNSTLQVNASDISISVWLKVPAGNPDSRALWIGGSTTTESGGISIGTYFGYVRNHAGGNWNMGTASLFVYPVDTWFQFVMIVRSNGQVEEYANGKFLQSWSGGTSTFADVGQPMTIGTSQYYRGNYNWAGSIALLRVSLTIPTAEQIKKMYNDEKHLFQENAKATLYGASDAVTALAYDDDTELLHVGTSAGRSVFQGLNRVDNTTDAVGTAISASNGLVAED